MLWDRVSSRGLWGNACSPSPLQNQKLDPLSFILAPPSAGLDCEDQSHLEDVSPSETSRLCLWARAVVGRNRGPSPIRCSAGAGWEPVLASRVLWQHELDTRFYKVRVLKSFVFILNFSEQPCSFMSVGQPWYPEWPNPLENFAVLSCCYYNFLLLFLFTCFRTLAWWLWAADRNLFVCFDVFSKWENRAVYKKTAEGV